MPSFILRGLDPEFWKRVQAKAKAEGVAVKATIIRLLTTWLGVVILSACALPLEPSPPSTPPAAQIPASISLTANGATSANEALLNILVSGASGKGVYGVTVTLTTTAGTLNHTTVSTGTNGTAQALLRTTNDATVTARTNGISATIPVIAYRVAPLPPPSVYVPPPPPPPPSPPSPAPDPTLAATLTCTVGDTSPAVATVCNVAATYGSASIPSADITRVDWDWGDGSTATVLDSPLGSRQYTQAGTYRVIATVTADVSATVPGIAIRVASVSTSLIIP